MKSKIRIIGVSLASMAGLLLVSGVAWAQAGQEEISWWNTGYTMLEPAERFWVDEDGIEHGRDELGRNRRRGGLRGVEEGPVSWDWDRATGDYFERGYFTYTGSVLGGEPTSGVGHYTIECHRIEDVQTCTGHDLVQLDGGGLVQTSAAWEGGEDVIWTGIVLDPPGGAKRQGPRPRR
jgi:hypothetical protein